jgi:hypothetical protein
VQAFVLIVLLAVAFEVRPYQSGIVAHRTAPDGTQAVVSQTWNGWSFEWYTVRLHARKPGGGWKWHYIDHEASRWSGCKLRFSEDNRTLFLSGGDGQPRSFDLTEGHPAGPPPYLPADFKDQP